MAGLPPGWEWDYDGQRWFYKYKPTGHIQYHFPSEGDEFPDFIEAGAPAPDLAPEERLESQQQVKRQTSSAGTGSGTGRKLASAPDSNGGINKYGMSATAKPISAFWEGDEEAEADGVFQPENFMFLGPGTYADVSPLNEEEEEAAKRSVVGGIGERVESAGTPATVASTLVKSVSPMASGKTTPMMAKSEPSASPQPAAAAVKGGAVIESPPVIESQPAIESPPVIESAPISSPPAIEVNSPAVIAEAAPSATVHMIDSREMPVEMMGDTIHRFNPVGFMAEMPTEHTGVAHIEVHPDPVEIADNSILAPIETSMAAAPPTGMAELPEKSSPVEGKEVPIMNAPKGPERKQSTEADRMATSDGGKFVQQVPHELASVPTASQDITGHQQTVPPPTQSITQAQGNQGPAQNYGHYDTQPAQQAPSQTAALPQLETFKITRKPPGSTPGTPIVQQPQQPMYQAYVPGQVANTSQMPTSDKRHSVGLGREPSLMMGSKRDSISIDPNSIPKILSPPQGPAASTASQGGAPSHPEASDNNKQVKNENKSDDTDPSLAHVPSVLKPARNRNSIQGLPYLQQATTPPAVVTPPAQTQQEPPKTEGVSKFPSVLRPARGRSSSQTGSGVNDPIQSQSQPQAFQTQPAQNIQPTQGHPLLGGQVQPIYQVQPAQSPPPAQQPPIQRPAWQAAQAVQPARPASALPVVTNARYGSQYAVADSGPTPNQQQYELVPSGQQQPLASQLQPSPLQQMQTAVSNQPPRPQTVIGTVQHGSINMIQTPAAQAQQGPALQSQTQEAQHIHNFHPEQPVRPQSVVGNIPPPPSSAPKVGGEPSQQPAVSHFQVLPAQQVHNMAAGQPQAQPQNEHAPASHFQVPQSQHVQNASAGQPTPQKSMPYAGNAGQAVGAQPLPAQQQPQLSQASQFQVQPLQNVQNAQAGQPVRPLSMQATPNAGQTVQAQSPPPQHSRQPLPASTSQYQVQPSQQIQNAAAGQPIRPHGSQSPHGPTPPAVPKAQQAPVSQFQVQPLQQSQNASAGQPTRPQDIKSASSAGQSIGVQSMPLHQQPTASVFQVQPLQNIQNASAGQPTRPHGSSENAPPLNASGPSGVQPIPAEKQQPFGSQFQFPQPQQVQNAAETRQQPHLQQHPPSQFQAPASQAIQNEVAGQPMRPQSAIGTIQHTPPPNSSQPVFGQHQQQPGPGPGEPVHPGMRRVSTFTPGEVSSTRPREDSQVSSLGQSPSPMDMGRRTSSNAMINGPNYTPSPLTDANGPVAQNQQAQSAGPNLQGSSPPVPAKIREHVEGSFFPAQNTPDPPPSQDEPKQQQQQQQQQRPQQQRLTQIEQAPGQEKQLPREPTQDTEHPIGYQIKPLANQPSPAPSGQQGVGTPGSGHILGRIEEHDEVEQGPKVDQTPQATRPSSMASSIQQSIPDTPGSSHGPTIHQPKPLAPSQLQRPVQALGQSPMAQSPLGQAPIGQPAPVQHPQGMMQPGPIPQPQQGQWNMVMNPNIPPQPGKEKEKKWTKWFKGSGTKVSKPPPQQQMTPQPGPIPGPGPQQWTGGPYSPSHFWQQPGQQGPFSHGQHPSMSDSASISTVGSDKKSQHSQHSQQMQQGQGPIPMQSGPSGPGPVGQLPQVSHPQGQMRPGQASQHQHPGGQMLPQMRPGPMPAGLTGPVPQGQFYPGQMPPGQHPPGQVAQTQMRPGQQMPGFVPPGQPTAGQMPPGHFPPAQGYFGHMHPLQMPISQPTQQFTQQQHGQMGMAAQGSPNPNQPLMGHSRTPSTASHASGVPQQNLPPQQTQPAAGYQTQQSPEHNMMPAPLFASPGGNPAANGKSTQAPAQQQASQPPPNNKWAQRPAADYSGGDWGEEENWDRR